MIRIKRGLNIPIGGSPRQEICDGPPIQTVALVGDDYTGMRPSMLVEEGDAVQLGQTLFTDKKTPGVRYTSPGSGTVIAINRGAKRKFESIVIRLETEEELTFSAYDHQSLAALARADVLENLIKSGLWTSFRARPFSKVPPIDSVPHSIFVTAMDSNPLAADVERIIGENHEFFVAGLQVMTRLTDGNVFVCKAVGANVPGDDIDRISIRDFDGPHPAGLPGTHIHFLDPVSNLKTVWHVSHEDVISIGALFCTGRIRTERTVAVAGPGVKDPRLIRTRLGANLSELTRGELREGDHRLISGSVLCGRHAEGPLVYLGRHHLQVSVLLEGHEREFLGWQMPGLNKFSAMRVFASSWFGRRKQFAFDTSTQGSDRPMVPIGAYEKVMPLDVIPTFLLRALIVGDTEQAQALGCLELDEEDLALCTFVCPGKYDFGEYLRKNLTQIERDG